MAVFAQIKGAVVGKPLARGVVLEPAVFHPRQSLHGRKPEIALAVFEHISDFVARQPLLHRIVVNTGSTGD
jgi:hypothetical protein